jgi:hypothetical protein
MWKRRGNQGTIFFIDGVIETLIASGAVSEDEAEKWKVLLITSLTAPSPESHSQLGTTHVGSGYDSPKDFATFIALIPIIGARTTMPNKSSLQLIGLELYDSKAAIIWRALPPPSFSFQERFGQFSQNSLGPDLAMISLKDDIQTNYVVMHGHSGGRTDRVGRFEFWPAPPGNATVLYVRLGTSTLEVPLSRSRAPGSSQSS